MNKRLIFLIAAFIVTALFLFRLIQGNIQRENAKPQANIEAVYDEAVFGGEPDTSKVEELTSKNEELPDSTQLLQTFKSGQLMAISLPSSPTASSSALKQNPAKGLQLTSDDYYANIFHILKLDDATDLCKTLVGKNAHAGLYIRNKTPVKTSATSSTIWELTNSQGSTIKQINGCYADGKNKVWIVDFYISLKKYEEKYKNEMIPILNSFAFTK